MRCCIYIIIICILYFIIKNSNKNQVIEVYPKQIKPECKGKSKIRYYLDKNSNKLVRYYEHVLQKKDKINVLEKADLIFKVGYLKKLSDDDVIELNKVIVGNMGIKQLHDKDSLWTILVNKYGLNEAAKLTPESVKIEPNINYDDFFNRNNPPYLLKKNIENGDGILIVNNKIDAIEELKRDKEYVVLQKLIESLLIKGYAFKIRTYVVTACIDGNTSVYLAKDSPVAYALTKWDSNNLSFDNIYASRNWFDDMSQSERIKQLDGKETMLSKMPNDLMNTILPQIIEKSKKVFSIVNLCSKQNTILISGIDFLVDTNHNVYFLELNTLPGVANPYAIDNEAIKYEKQFKQNLYNDSLSIIFPCSFENTGSLLQII